MHLAYIWIVSHLSAKNYRNLWKFDEVLTKTNLLSFFFGTRCISVKQLQVAIDGSLFFYRHVINIFYTYL